MASLTGSTASAKPTIPTSRLRMVCRNNRDVKGELVLHLGSGLLVLGIDVQNISVAIDWAHPVGGATKSSLCWQTLAKTVGPNIPRYASNEASYRAHPLGQMCRVVTVHENSALGSSCFRKS